jgi:hypothetical protein
MRRSPWKTRNIQKREREEDHVTVYIVKLNGATWDIVKGVCTSPELATEIAHRVQDLGIDEKEHLEIAVVETDKFLEEGA